jgi:RNA polymerase sigma factor (sigma-70 family)
MLWLPGSSDEQEAALRLERARLVRLCAQLTGDIDAAEDLAQETLYEALRNEHKLHDPRGRSAWLSAIARNICRRWSHGQGRELSHRVLTGADTDDLESRMEGVLGAEPDLEMELEREALAELLDRALALLPVETRAILVQKYVEDAPYSEIAQRLGLSEGAVAVRLQRGKLALHRVLRSELLREVAAYGFWDAGSDRWEETHVWCPACGQQRLLGSVFRDGQHARLMLRCPGCTPEGYTFVEGDVSLDAYRRVLGDVRSYRSAMLRITTDVSGCLTAAVPSRVARCPGCGRMLPLKTTSPQGRYGLHIWCGCCSASTNTAPLTLALSQPEGRQFRRHHPRMRARPEREVETEGHRAIVTGFESVTDSSTLDVIFALDDYQVIAIHGVRAR